MRGFYVTKKLRLRLQQVQIYAIIIENNQISAIIAMVKLWEVLYWGYYVSTSKYFRKADSLMFTATMGGKTIATVEISLNDYSILQCRAFANDICKYTEQIANIINTHKKMIAERTESRRVSA